MLDLILQVVPIPNPADPAYSSVYLKVFGIVFSIGMLVLLIYEACDRVFFDDLIILHVMEAILGCLAAWLLLDFGMIPLWVFVLYIIIVVLVLIVGYLQSHGKELLAPFC